MQKLKLMTIIGTRPEIIRLSSCIAEFDRCFEHILVHTGQNWDYELNKVFFDDLSIRPPDFCLDCAGKTVGETIGNIISLSYQVLQREKPDALLVLGDTNSALSVISAKRLKIPIFHMEAGNRCFDFNVPEEINRRIVDHISDINLPYTEHARRYLISEGFKKEHIFVTGSPMTEVLHNYADKIDKSEILEKLELKENGYFLLSAHREENIDNKSNFMSLMNALNAVAQKYQIPVIYSAHPRSMKMIKERGFTFNSLVKCMKPFGFLDYCKLQMNARCVLSDSGTLSEESSILGFNAILLRTSTERPEVLDKGTLLVGGIFGNDVLQAVELALEMKSNSIEASMAVDYKDSNVSAKVTKIIQSYMKIINHDTWGKSFRPCSIELEG